MLSPQRFHMIGRGKNLSQISKMSGIQERTIQRSHADWSVVCFISVHFLHRLVEQRGDGRQSRRGHLRPVTSHRLRSSVLQALDRQTIRKFTFIYLNF